MSLLNAWITQTASILAVDTDGVGQDGRRMPSSKLLPIPHLNAVLAVRGQSALLSFVHLRCISSAFESFDDLDAALPAILQEADEALQDEHIIKDCRIGSELLAIGWSDKAGRMLGRQYVRRDDQLEFSSTDAAYHVAPWHSSLSGVQIGPHAIEEMARAQVQWMREHFPNAACGGHLVVCSLTRDEMAFTHKFVFDDMEVEQHESQRNH